MPTNNYITLGIPFYKVANTIQNILSSKNIKTAPLWILRVVAFIGDLIKKIIKIDPPLTSFRLDNMLTGASYPIDKTRKVVGDLPFDLDESVFLTAQWMYENNLIKHKPRKI